MRNKNIARIKSLIIIFSMFLLTSCLDIGKIEIYLTLNKDDLYAGQARIEFVNIHSSSETVKEQKKEMDEFFTDFKQHYENIIEVMPLYKHTSEFRNKNDLSTDVIVHGEFKNILTVLGSLICENNFHIEGNRKKLAASWGNTFTDRTDTNLTIQYPGKIVSHNSKKFDPKTGTMKWNMSKTGDKEVSFILQSE